MANVIPLNIVTCLLQGLARHYNPPLDGRTPTEGELGAFAGLIAGVDCDHRIQARALDVLCSRGLAFKLASGRYAITNNGLKLTLSLSRQDA